MEMKAKRTLVKSAPELWELADDSARMEAWMAGLVGAAHPIAIEVTDREPERILAWRSADADARGRIAIELAESGFGTAVWITAEHARPDPGAAIAALEGLLDELGSPDRRPFSRAEPRRPARHGAGRAGAPASGEVRGRARRAIGRRSIQHCEGARRARERPASYAFAKRPQLGSRPGSSPEAANARSCRGTSSTSLVRAAPAGVTERRAA